MQTTPTNPELMQLQEELKKEKSNFALEFHRGKSMVQLQEMVDRIHTLEKKLTTLYNYQTN